MKIFAFAFAILLAGVSAVPSLSPMAADLENKANERFVDLIIAGVIADLAQDMRDMGLDPLEIGSVRQEIRLPVTNLLEVDIVVDQLTSTGLSNIVIEDSSYGILTSRLQMTIALPRVFVGVENAQLDVLLLGGNLNAGVSGSLAIVDLRVRIDVRINIGIISGISIRSIDVDFTLGGVESNLNVQLQDLNLSDAINNFAEVTVPTALANNRAEINELLEYIIVQLV